MKIKKNTQQKNFIIAREYYKRDDLREMFNNNKIFFISEERNTKYQPMSAENNYSEYELECFIKDSDKEFRISTSELKEVKVIVEDGYYITVGVDLDGNNIYVNV